MGVPSLVFAGVVLLNSVDISLQMQSFFANFGSPGRVETSDRRSPSPPRRYELPEAANIIRDVRLEQYYYKMAVGAGFGSLKGKLLEVVVNDQHRIVAVFLLPQDKTLYGLYLEEGNSRIEVDPLRINLYGYMNYKDSSAYPEFKQVPKPQYLFIASLADYTHLRGGCRPPACQHTSPHVILKDLPKKTHLIANVRFSENFVIAQRTGGPYKSLKDFTCDVVVDPRTRKIVAVFLSESKHMIFGIYLRKSTSRRIVLPTLKMNEEHFDFLDDVGYKLYPEFVEFKRSQEMYKTSLEACG